MLRTPAPAPAFLCHPLHRLSWGCLRVWAHACAHCAEKRCPKRRRGLARLGALSLAARVHVPLSGLRLRFLTPSAASCRFHGFSRARRARRSGGQVEPQQSSAWAQEEHVRCHSGSLMFPIIIPLGHLCQIGLAPLGDAPSTSVANAGQERVPVLRPRLQRQRRRHRALDFRLRCSECEGREGLGWGWLLRLPWPH